MLVFLLPVIVYTPTLLGTFYYDDNTIFFGHQVRNLVENPFSVFAPATHYLPGVPRSLHVFILLLVYKLFGASPLPYHLLTLLLHGITSLLVYMFVRELTAESQYPKRIALTASLFFGLHPIHTENITFVTLGGTDLLMTLFAILSLLLYLNFRKSTAARRYVFLFFSLLAYLFSLLSKEAAIGFILVFPLTELMLKKKDFLWTIPYLLIPVVVKWDVISGIPGILGKSVGSGGGGQRDFLKLFDSLGYTLKALLLPYPQSVLIKEFGPRSVTFFFIALSLLTFFICVRFLRGRKLLVYASVLLLAASLPYLFVPFAEGNIAVFAERYLYAPSVGFCLFVAIVLVNLLEYRKSLAIAALLLFAVCSFEGVRYFYSSWRTEEAFWDNAVNRNPDYVTGYVNLAFIEKTRGRTDKANELLAEGLSKPKGLPAEFALAAYNLGINAMQSGQYSKAESYFMYSLQRDNFQLSYVSLGFLYLDLGRAERAKWAFENALQFNTPSSRAMYGLAKSCMLLGDIQQARRYAEEVYYATTNPELKNLAAQMLR